MKDERQESKPFFVGLGMNEFLYFFAI